MANSGTEDIIQNIVLAGQEDVIAGFNAIREAGVAAFEAIGGSIQLGPLTEVAETIAGIGAAAAIAAAGIFEWADASANAVYNLSNLADQAGTSISEFTGLATAIGDAGASIDGMGVALRRMAVRVGVDWEAIQKNVNAGSDAIVDGALKVRAAALQTEEAQERVAAATQRSALIEQEAALSKQKAEADIADAQHRIEQEEIQAGLREEKFQSDQLARDEDNRKRKYADQEEDLNRQQEYANDAITIAGAQLSLEEAILRDREAHGERVSDQEKKDLAVRRADLAVTEAEARLEQAQQKAVKDRRDAEERDKEKKAEQERRDREDALLEEERQQRKREEQYKIQKDQQDLKIKGAEIQQHAAEQQLALDQRDTEVAQEQQRLELERDQHRQQAIETAKKADEASRDSVANAAKYVDALAKTPQDQIVTEKAHALQDVLGETSQKVTDEARTVGTKVPEIALTAQNLLKGIFASTSTDADAIKNSFDKPFTSIIGAAPKLQEVILKTADVFHNMTDETLKNAVATQLFGRAFSQTLVESLSQGSQSLQKEQARLKEQGFLEFDVDSAKKLRAEYFTLGNEVKAVGIQMGEAFGPAVTGGLEGIRAIVEKNHVAMVEWASDIGGKLAPAITGLLESLSGVDLTKTLDLSPDQVVKAGEWKADFDAIKGYAEEFGSALANVATAIIIPAFEGAHAILNAIGDALTALTGHKITGEELGITILIAQLTGVLTLLRTIALTFTTVVLGNPFAIAIIGAVTLGFALVELITHWREIAQWKPIQDLLNAFRSGIAAAQGEVTKLYNQLTNFVGFDPFASVKAGAQSLADSLTSLTGIKITPEALGVTALAGSITAVIAVVGTLAGGFGAIATLNPFTLAIVGAVALGIGLEELVEHWNDILQWQPIQDLLATFREGASATVGIVTQLYSSFTQFIGFDPLKEVAQGVQLLIAGFQELASIKISPEALGAAALQAALTGIDALVEGLSSAFHALASVDPFSLVAAGASALEGVLGDLVSLWDQIAQWSPVADLLAGLRAGISSAISVAESLYSTLSKFLGFNPFASIEQGIETLVAGITTAIDAAEKLLKALGGIASAGASTPVGSGGSAQDAASAEAGLQVEGHASGGMVGGRSGRDTNIIAATRGEYVVQEPAVSHWGTSFMDSINNMRMPKFEFGGLVSNLGSMIPKFAEGGSVDVPKFAEGGLNSGSRGLTLVLDGKEHTGFSGSHDAVGALERAVVHRGITSLGRINSARK